MRSLLLALCLFAASAQAENAAPPIHGFTLKNGMEVIVVENHRVPAVNHALWFRVGAGDDPRGKSGLAHYHEHMMFQGSARYKKGEYADIIARSGGRQNAFTGHDATAYWASVPTEELPLVMELEADRLRGLQPKAEDALKEREVIIEERRSRTDNVPQALFAEQVNAALYLNHPYHFPIIGWKHEMEGLTQADALAFHAQYYHAGNAILILSGDVTETQARQLAERYYGKLPAGPKVARAWPQEPPQLAERRITMHHALVTLPEWQRTCIAPGVNDGEREMTPALFVLEQVLGGGKASRLYQALVVKQKIASAVSADYDGLRLGPGEFSLSAAPASNDVDLEKLEHAARAELSRVAERGITTEELSRAQTLLKAQTVFARDGLAGTSRLLGWIRAVGLPVDYYTRWPQMIDAVTGAQVQEAAKRMANTAQCVTGTLTPEEKQ